MAFALGTRRRGRGAAVKRHDAARVVAHREDDATGEALGVAGDARHGGRAGDVLVAAEGDVVREFGNVKVITDKMSDPYLSGATIDFVDTIEKQGFTIDNPNAQGSCACGDSFN